MTNKLIDVHGYEDGMSPTGNPYNVPLSVANMLIYAGRASLSAGSAVSGSPEDGFAGFTGWTAIPSMTIYDGKLVMRLSWVGGTGAAPTAIYVGPNSLVAIPADAVDMVWRMYQGEDTTEEGVAGTPVVGKSGWSPVPTLVADGADRQVMHITWSGGTGTPPPDGFVGAGELVATAALAVNLKGESSTSGAHVHAVADVTGLDAAMAAKADLIDGKLDLSQLPDIAISEYLGAVATQAAMLALTGQKGDWCSRNDNGKVYVVTGTDTTVIGGWTQLSYPVPAPLDLPGMTAITAAGTAEQKTAQRDAMGLGPIATMTLPEAQSAVSEVFKRNVPLATGNISVGGGLTLIAGTDDIDAHGNTAFGQDAGLALQNTWANTTCGWKAGFQLGPKSVGNTYGGGLGNVGNTFYGYYTGAAANGALDCTVVGTGAATNLTTGMDLVVMGVHAALNIEAAGETVALGHATLRQLIGVGSLANIDSTVTDQANAAYSWGHRITAVGDQAGRFLNDRNYALIRAKKCVYIGAATTASGNHVFNENVYGYMAAGKGSNTASYGGVDVTDHYFNSGKLNAPGTPAVAANKAANLYIDPETGAISRTTAGGENWTPTMVGTSNVGGIVPTVMTARFVRLSGYVWYTIEFTAGAGTTGTGGIRFSLPSSAAEIDNVTGWCLTSGEVLGGVLVNSENGYSAPFVSGQAGIYNSSGNVVSEGRIYIISGKYLEA